MTTYSDIKEIMAGIHTTASEHFTLHTHMDNVFIQVQIIYCKQETTVEE
jgi:hypothetical protein